MSSDVSSTREFLDAARERMAQVVRQVRRTAPGPLLVRLIAGAGAMLALAVAVPLSVLFSSQVGLLVPVAAGVSLFPRTRWVSAAGLVAVAAWLIATIGLAEPILVGRVALVAGGLYVMHAAAALAAVLPYDCAVGSGPLLRWAIRVVGVLVVSLGLGLTGMVLVERLVVAGPTLIGPIIGVAIAIGIAGLLAWQTTRRS